MDESELSRADVAVFFSRFPKCTKMYIDGKKIITFFQNSEILLCCV